MTYPSIPNALAEKIRQDYDYPDGIQPAEALEEALRLDADGAESMRPECPDVRAGDWFISDGVTGAIYRQWLDGLWDCIWSSY